MHDHVGEVADHAFELGARAPGDGGADQNVVLIRIAREQQLERAEQRHVQRRLLLAAERTERVHERGIEGKALACAGKARRFAATVVGEQDSASPVRRRSRPRQ